MEQTQELWRIEEPMGISLKALDILSDKTKASVKRILQENLNAKTLRSYNLTPANRLLFYGLPECGQEIAALVLASELATSLVTVHINKILTSSLSETRTNLRNIFDFIGTYPSRVVLFDGSDNAISNTFLLKTFFPIFSNYKENNILILKSRWLRNEYSGIFDEKLNFDKPNSDQIKKILKMKLSSWKCDFDIDDIAEYYINNNYHQRTHDEIERILTRAMKMAVLINENIINIELLNSAIEEEVNLW